MVCLQDFTPVRESVIWPLLHRFYMEMGPAAWGKQLVPQRCTANCYTADAYAAIVADFLRDLVQQHVSKEPLVIELGGGSGRFAWQFLNRMFNYHFIDGEPCPAFTYLLTDGASKNIRDWEAKERFRPLVESGVLQFAELSITPDPVIRTADESITPEDLADRPVVIVANYLLDSIASDMFRIRNHGIEQVFMALETDDPDFLDRPLTSFRNISERFRSEPVEGAPTGHPLIDRILSAYAQQPGDFHVVVPQIGFTFLERFLARRAPLLLLAGDLAYSDPAQFDLGSPFIFDSYFAHYTNMHMIAELFRMHGGHVQMQRHPDTNFACAAMLLPTASCRDDTGDDVVPAEEPFRRTRMTARTQLRDFNPFDAHELVELLEETATEVSIRRILALLRLSRFDPVVAEACLPLLFQQIEQGEEAIPAPQLYESYMEAYRALLPGDTPVTLDCGMAHLFLQIGYPAHALQLLAQSTAEHGETARRLFLQALVRLRCGDREAAIQTAKRSLALDPDFGPSQRLLAEQEELAQRNSTTGTVARPSVKGHDHLIVPYAHKDVVRKAGEIFHRSGVVLIDQFISPALVAQLRAAHEECVRDWQSSGLGKPNNVGDKRFTVPIRIRPPFDNPAVYANPVLIEMLTAAMGERPVLHAFGAVVTHKGARMQHIHREHPLLFNSDEANAHVPTYAVTVLVPLIDLDEESGGTQLWEGSHKLPKDAPWEGEPHVIYTPAGSALVMDYRLYHGGMPCQANHGRPLLYYTYAMPWFTDTLAFESHAALGMSDEERLRIPDDHRYLFRFAKRVAA